jgi:hypothetical protein
VELLDQLRRLLPAEIGLWAGGAGVVRVGAVGGVELIGDFESALTALADWRASRVPG